MSNPSEPYPEYDFSFYVIDEIDAEMRREIFVFVEHLGEEREWMIGKPEPEDDEDPVDPDNLPPGTYGGYVMLETASVHNLSRETELRQLEEIEYLVGRIKEFSKLHNLTFRFIFGGDYVGHVTAGEADKILSERYLADWRWHLEQDR